MSAPPYSARSADPFSYTLHECGCQTWTQGGEFVIDPCKLADCTFYQSVMEVSKAAGNQIRFKIKEK